MAPSESKQVGVGDDTAFLGTQHFNRKSKRTRCGRRWEGVGKRACLIVLQAGGGYEKGIAYEEPAMPKFLLSAAASLVDQLDKKVMVRIVRDDVWTRVRRFFCVMGDTLLA